MKNVIKKISIVLLLITLTIFTTGCVNGIVSEQEYGNLLFGVSAEDENGNSVFYEIQTLIDNIEFNSTIQSKAYCKLDIYLKKSCQIKGVVFLVRSSENCKLKFTTYIDGESVSTTTQNLLQEKTSVIEMFFTNTITCLSDSNFYIEIEQLNTEENEKTSFKFDSLIIFLQE